MSGQWQGEGKNLLIWEDNPGSNFSKKTQKCILRTASLQGAMTKCLFILARARMCVRVALLHLLARPCSEGSGLHGPTHRSLVTRCFLCGSHRVKEESTELHHALLPSGCVFAPPAPKIPPERSNMPLVFFSPDFEAFGIRPRTEHLKRVASSVSLQSTLVRLDQGCSDLLTCKLLKKWLNHNDLPSTKMQSN